MLTYYLILDVPTDASDEEIRDSYLKWVKKYTPEKDPVRFRKITEAYEALKDERSRVRQKMFGAMMAQDYEKALLALADAREPRRRRVGLKELLET
jgi:DnaJ-class molecular chaperone